MVMLTFRLPLAFALTFSVLTLATGQGRDDKKSKLPPLTFLGNVDGVIDWVDDGSDRITLNVKDYVREAAPNPTYGPGRLLNGRVQYVIKEKIVQKTYNLSPEVKIRLMNKKAEPAKNDKKKPDAKGASKKDPKKDGEAVKDADEADKGEKDKMAEKGQKPEKDLDANLGGLAGKKSNLVKGQLVRLALGRNSDPVNPQIYVMAVFVYSDGK